MLPTEWYCHTSMKSSACTCAELWLDKSNVAVASTVFDIIFTLHPLNLLRSCRSKKVNAITYHGRHSNTLRSRPWSSCRILLVSAAICSAVILRTILFNCMKAADASFAAVVSVTKAPGTGSVVGIVKSTTKGLEWYLQKWWKFM